MMDATLRQAYDSSKNLILVFAIDAAVTLANGLLSPSKNFSTKKGKGSAFGHDLAVLLRRPY